MALLGILPMVLAYAALSAMVFVPLEDWFPRRAPTRTAYRTDLWFATAGAAMAQLTLALVVGAALGLGASVPWQPLATLHPALAVPLGLVLFEGFGYAYHRAAHRLPTLRRLHEVHHASEDMDWLAGFRQHPLEIVLMTLAQNLPLVVLGLPLASHAVLAIGLRLHTLFVHANLAVPPWLSPWIATPEFHHRHHARHRPDANFSGLFPWLDLCFGTYDSEQADDFGLPGLPQRTFPEYLLDPLTPSAPAPAETEAG